MATSMAANGAAPASAPKSSDDTTTGVLVVLGLGALAGAGYLVFRHHGSTPPPPPGPSPTVYHITLRQRFQTKCPPSYGYDQGSTALPLYQLTGGGTWARAAQTIAYGASLTVGAPVLPPGSVYGYPLGNGYYVQETDIATGITDCSCATAC